MSLPTSNRLSDHPDSFGWISISLHWITAILIIALWFIGTSIGFQAAEDVDARRALHVTIGLIAWLLLAVRILWRLRSSHPKAQGQTDRIHKLASAVHYFMLGLVTIMLVSGPVSAWAVKESLVSELARNAHAVTANFLIILVILHILAGLKHLMFHDDETVARIFKPRN
ncbi:MAG: cytochrome b/b6 domain-containing protein [Pseudohongiellaceae bacterium]